MSSNARPDASPPPPGIWLWGGLGLIALLLRLDQLSAVTLWYDEAAAWKTISLPGWLMMRSITANVHPPGYYLLLKVWSELWGDSPAALRSLSVLLGLVTVGLVGRLAREIVIAIESSRDRMLTTEAHIQSLWASWTAAALYAVHPIALEQSQQARMYAMGLGLTAGLGIGLVRMMMNPRSPGAWGLVILCGNGLVLTHYYGLLTALVAVIAVGGISLRVWWQEPMWRRSLVIRWVLALWFSGQVIAWWGPTFLAQRERVQEDYWIAPWARLDVVMGLAGWVSGFAIHDLSAGSLIGLASLTGLLIGSLCFWRRLDRSRPWNVIGLMLALILGPIVISTGMSLTGRNILQPRYWCFAHLFFVVAIACRWRIPVTTGGRGPGLTRPGALVLVWGIFWAGHYHVRRTELSQESGITQAIACLQQMGQPADLVLVQSPFVYLTIQHGLGHRMNLYQWDNSQPLKHHQGSAVIFAHERIRLQDPALTSARRLWVVADNLATGAFADEQIRPPVDWTMQQHWPFREANPVAFRLDLRLYKRSSPTATHIP